MERIWHENTSCPVRPPRDVHVHVHVQVHVHIYRYDLGRSINPTLPKGSKTSPNNKKKTGH